MMIWVLASFLASGMAADLPPLAYEHGLSDFSTIVQVETADKHVKAFMLGGHNFQTDPYNNQSQEMMALDMTEGQWQYHLAETDKPVWAAGLGLATDGKTLISVGGCYIPQQGGYPQSTKGVRAFTNLIDPSGGKPEVKSLGDIPASVGEEGGRCRGVLVPTNLPHLRGGHLFLGGYSVDVTGMPGLIDKTMWVNTSAFLEGKPQAYLLNFTASLPTHGLPWYVDGPVGDFFATVVDNRWVYAMGGSSDWTRDSCSSQCLKMDLTKLRLEGQSRGPGEQGGCASGKYGACWEACAMLPLEASGDIDPKEDGKCGLQGVYLPKLRKIVIAGGKTMMGTKPHFKIDTSNKVFTYDIDTDTWSTLGTVEHKRLFGGAAAMPDGASVAVFGGTNYDAGFRAYMVVNETDVVDVKQSPTVVV